MPKLKNRLLATLLALTTSITAINLPQSTIKTYAANTAPDVYMGTAMSPDLESNSIDFSRVSAANIEPEIQTLRVSLIKCKVGAPDSDDSTGGKPVTTSEIPDLKMNPIHLVPIDYTWSGKKPLVKSPANTDPTRTTSKGLSAFNSRREYLANDVNGSNASANPTTYVMSYNTVWEPDSTNPNVGHWLFNDSKFITKTINGTVFPDRCVGNVLFSSQNSSQSQKAYYQQNPPTADINPDMQPSEYLDAIAKAVFVDEQYGQTEAKQVFLYHVVSKMLNKPSDPYCAEVEAIVEQIIDHKYDILIEPTITFKADTNGTIDAMFNIDPGQYVTLTCGDLFCEDVLSTIYYGATSKDTSYEMTTPDGTHRGGNRYRGYNPLTHNSSTADSMLALYRSLQLKHNYARDNLYAVDNKDYYNSGFNYSTGTYTAGSDYWGHPNSYSGTIGPLLTGATIGTGGAAYTGIFYQRLANLISGDPSSVKCDVDMASMYSTGGLYIVDPSFSTVNYTVTAKGYGDSIEYKTTPSGQIPVYKDAFNDDTVTFNVETRLKMDKDVNDPAQPRGTKWVDEILNEAPTNYNDINELPVYDSDDSDARQVRPVTTETTKAVIPAITKSSAVLYYADENGVPLSTYNQVNNSQGNQNSAVITKDESTGQFYKLFLDNVNYYAYNPQNEEAETYQLSVSNSKSTERMADTRVGVATSTFSEQVEDGTNWINIKIPPIENRPQNARYILIKASVNLGATQKHTADPELSKQETQSRPQQIRDSMGNISNEYALAYSKDSPGSVVDAKAIGVTESIEQQNDNMVMLLIPIGKEYDLSANRIQIDHEMSDPNPTNGSTTLQQLSIKTESSATDPTKEDYAGKETGEMLYTYITTNANKAQEIADYFNNEKRSNPNTTSTDISGFDYTKGGAYSAEFVRSISTKKPISLAVTSTTTDTNITNGEEDYLDEEETLNWDIGTPNEDIEYIKQAINQKFTGNIDTVYLVAGLIINDDPSNPTQFVPGVETYWNNNFIANVEPIVRETDSPTPPPDSRTELTCYPSVGDPSNSNRRQKTLTEINNYRECSSSDLSIAKMGGLTEYGLSKPNPASLVYGAQVKATVSIPNTSPLGKRTVLKYNYHSRIVTYHCSEHSSATDKTFPDGFSTFPTGVLDNNSDTRDMVMHNWIFKYLEFDSNKNRFVIKNQAVNDGYFVSGSSSCTHCSARKCSRRTRESYIKEYKLASEQPDVEYTILFDHNYAQSIKNSMIYSIDSLLANSADKGKYAYLIEAGSRFGVNLQERIITDIPVGNDIKMKADCYYPYENRGGSSPLQPGFLMNNDCRIGTLVSEGDVIEALPMKIVSNIYDDYSSTIGNNHGSGKRGISSWDKSNESYNSVLLDPLSLDTPWYDEYTARNGSNYYKANDATLGLYSNYSVGNVSQGSFSLSRGFEDLSEDFKNLGVSKIGRDRYRLSPRTSSSWVFSSSSTTTDKYINVRYYRFMPQNANGVRGFYTNPDYPDSIKINNQGNAVIANQDAVRKFLNTPTAFEKAMGYQGLRVNIISYISDIQINGSSVKLKGLPYYNSSTSAIPGTSSEVIGDCTTYSLVVVGTTSNRYNVHSER